MNLQRHKDTDADVTVACVPMDYSHAAEYPLMKIDNEGQVIQFNEKPRCESLTSMQVDATVLGLSPNEARRKPFIASMGIYVFKKRVLLKLLRWRYPSANDFAAEILPASVNEFNVQAYLFRDYWEEIGTIKSFFDANLALTAQPPKFSFYDAAKPTFTSPRYLPPTKIERCRVSTGHSPDFCTHAEMELQKGNMESSSKYSLCLQNLELEQ
jgi:glucose-1-phosphate adenylyltransferase